MASPIQTFNWYEYIAFILMLALSTLIGIYFGFFGNKQATTREYLSGGKKMAMLPIAVSIAVSHFSGISLVAMPADVYRHGISVWWVCPSFLLMALSGIYIYLPVFFKLQLTSIYHYFERRFDNKTRLLAVVLYVLSELVRVAFFTYSSALAFSTASGFNLQLTSCVVGGVCIFYTSVGGFKTVVWTDILQFVVVVGFLLVACVIGVQTSGGVSSVWDVLSKGERLDLFDFDFTTPRRDSFWSILFGYAATMISFNIIHQTGVQKFLAVPTFRSCVWAVVNSSIILFVVNSCFVLLGILIYAKYWNCDPLLSKKIARNDQLLIYYVMDIAGDISGIPGLFIAAIFSASLSSISSSLNSLSGVIYKDLICIFLTKDYSEKNISNILKLIVALSGIACTGLVFIIERLGELWNLAMTALGVVNGPFLGLFTLGCLFPKANAKGAFYGSICTLFSMIGLVISVKYYERKGLVSYQPKPFFTDGCENWNETFDDANHVFNTTLSPINEDVSRQSIWLPHFILDLSFYAYPLLGMFATIILGLIISYITNRNDPPVDKILISPICHFLLTDEPGTVEAPLLSVEKHPGNGKLQN